MRHAGPVPIILLATFVIACTNPGEAWLNKGGAACNAIDAVVVAQMMSDGSGPAGNRVLEKMSEWIRALWRLRFDCRACVVQRLPGRLVTIPQTVQSFTRPLALLGRCES